MKFLKYFVNDCKFKYFMSTILIRITSTTRELLAINLEHERNETINNSVIRHTASWNSSNVLSMTVNSNISCQLFWFVSLLQPENSWLLTWNMKETYSSHDTSIRGEEQEKDFSGHVYISSYLRVKFVASGINTSNVQTAVFIFSKKNVRFL